MNYSDSLYGSRLENDAELHDIISKHSKNDQLKKYEKEKRNEEISKITNKIKHRQANKNANEIYSNMLPEDVQTLGTLGEQVGRMIPNIALSAINPTLGTMSMFTTSAGSESARLIDEGYDYKKSALTGGLKGLTEVATEKITGGIKFKGRGVLDDIVGNAIARGTKNKVSNFLATKGYQAVGEIGEEYISNVAGYGIDKMILNKNTSLSEVWEDTKETTKMTFLTTLTLNLMGLGGANFSKNTTVNQQFVNEYENITNTKLNEKQKSDLLNNVEQIKQEIETNSEISEVQEQNMMPMANNVAETANNEGSFSRKQEILNDIENETKTNNSVEILPTVNEENAYSNKTREKRLRELKEIDTSELGLIERSKINKEIRALEAGYNNVQEYEQAEKERIEKLKKESEEKHKLSQQKQEKQEVDNNSTSFDFKQKQLDIIKENNPADDDVHTWIRNINDIKTFEEAFFEDGEFSGMDPDFTERMARESIKSGKITIYSSYPIEQGVFVSPSQVEASQYAGGDTSKLYSKEVKIEDVAWIDGAEGQYAKADIENNQETLYNNNESESGINGNRQGDTNEIQEGIMESQEENAFSIDRYKQEETTIRQRGEVEYNDNDKVFADKLKNKYNKKAFIYDDTDTSYGGGLSYIDNDTIMFGRNALNDYGYDFLEGHEILEDINKNYKDVSENTINRLKEKLQDDEGFGDVFLRYLADMEDDVYQYYIDKPELIAKEIIGDLNGLRNANIDYRTLENYSSLKPELVQEIQNEILNLENTIYSKENSNKSSFSMEENSTTNEDIRYSNNSNFDEYIENRVGKEGTRTRLGELKLPTAKEQRIQNVAPTVQNNVAPTAKRKLNPTEIANLKMEDANTTPKLSTRKYEKGNKQSSFFQNITNKSRFLNEDFRSTMKNEENIEYYKTVSNKEILENAYNKLNETTNYYIETIEDFDEMKYNNAKEVKLSKQEYAILSGIVNSDSNIKPGRNCVETTNATYEVYFKETGEFKVIGKILDGGYNDTITNGDIQGTRSTGNAESGMQIHSSTIQQSRTGTRNDEISNVNKRRTRISDQSIGNGSSNSNNIKYSIQESENNAKELDNSSFFVENERDIQNLNLPKSEYQTLKNKKIEVNLQLRLKGHLVK